eukprot:TRINITY_DN4392_c0_g2_i1.p1 TRINITY_DN4392_c0_g2~~TRINITY_DN4392_c0_g2_i1.p1  ORF type:complete len:954 (-),score=179.46 TRINITY_DN4392_c0_g2_i1:35-2896(-)
MTWKATKLILLFAVLVNISLAVDRNKFKKCQDSPFCVRQRSFTKGMLDYSFVKDSVSFDGTTLKGLIHEKKTNTLYTMEVIRYQNDIVRLKLNEESPIKPRYEVQEVLLDGISTKLFSGFQNKGKSLELDLGNGRSFKIQLVDSDDVTSALKFDYYYQEKPVISANNRGLFYFEYLRQKETGNNEAGQVLMNADPSDPHSVSSLSSSGSASTKYHVNIDGINFDRAWENSFGGHSDPNEKGPQSVGMDVSFIGASQVYGIPEHATDFALKNTDGTDGGYSEPYRLYNLDVFEYELNEPMALYGTVPFLMSHSSNVSAAVFWLNAAETYVDISRTKTDGILGLFGSQTTSIDSRWMSESGIVDLFFMVGSSPKQIFQQFTFLTGQPELPPTFAISYHQCRWNYKDENEVAELHSKFEEHDIPYDVIWLDIEHTDGKRYFTWDKKNFPTPSRMIDSISKTGRKMVTIVDPHIKRDDNYYVHKIAKDNNYYVKDSDKTTDYEGYCWPGSSHWVDYLSPSIRDWWSELFDYRKYESSTPDLYTWNDMNEPSVFSGPEVTMRKNAIHHGGWEHRDVHNIYGMMMHRATAEGLVGRNANGNKRPFVLSRAFYAGTQRWGAIWTGDNAGQWSHLDAATPMLLTLGVSGIVFSGADVGGFFGNPEPELLVRWYQAGAYQPFFRAHAHLDAKRREPWVHGEPTTSAIRKAVLSRYSILPYLYTSFYQSYLSGVPVMRPLWVEFPQDESLFSTQDSFLLGAGLLVKPVTSAGQTQTEVNLPNLNDEEIWYDTDTLQSYSGKVTIDTPLDKIPVFQRGGSIIPRKTRIRRSSAQMKNDPFTLIIALDKKESYAYGEIYIDDGDSFEYKQGSYVYRKIEYVKDTNDNNKSVIKTSALGNGKMYTRTKVERIVVVGVSTQPKSVYVKDQNGKTRELAFEYVESTKALTLKRPDVIISTSWVIELLF